MTVYQDEIAQNSLTAKKLALKWVIMLSAKNPVFMSKNLNWS